MDKGRILIFGETHEKETAYLVHIEKGMTVKSFKRVSNWPISKNTKPISTNTLIITIMAGMAVLHPNE